MFPVAAGRQEDRRNRELCYMGNIIHAVTRFLTIAGGFSARCAEIEFVRKQRLQGQ
jgi:hypothetical protein